MYPGSWKQRNTYISQRKGILAHLCIFHSKSKQNGKLHSDTYTVEGERQVVKIYREENSWRSANILVSRIAHVVEP